jgi:LuxR family maltose regulon positive regulatory protein
LNSSDSSVSPQRVLTVLINELTEQIESPWWIVLEDYHYVASPVVHQLVDFLLENAPDGLHVVISTRTDPPLALPRFRARGQLAEMRSNSLRFREEETVRWLQAELTGLSLEDLNLLSEKTEGWVAALQIIRSTLRRPEAQDMDVILSGLNAHNSSYSTILRKVFKRLLFHCRNSYCAHPPPAHGCGRLQLGR